MKHIHYEEEQRFSSLWWIWIVISIPLMVPLLFINKETSQGDLTVLILTSLFGWIPVAAILFTSKLQIKIDERGLHYKFFPSVWKWKTIAITDIQDYQIANTKSLLEKLTLGYHINHLANCVRMNITGKKFIHIKLESGRKLSIGTEDSESFLAALDRLASTTEE